MNTLQEKVLSLKKELKNTIIASHYYQKDDVFDVADIVGDSLELARKSKDSNAQNVIFCGVEFMGQSVKILAPDKNVYMPKAACCAMARMIDERGFGDSVKYMIKNGIKKEDIVPVTYINSSAHIKAEVGKMNGFVCTSSNAQSIMQKALDLNKKVLFVPDRCLGQNIAKQMGKTHCTIGDGQDISNKDIICYDGFCSVHQVFSIKDIDFFRNKYKDILIISHLECDPQIVDNSDFVGSTSMMIKYIDTLPKTQKIAVATEFNLVKRLRKENTYVLSSSKPTCPTMNETSLQNLYDTMLTLRDNKDSLNEITLDKDTIHYASIALNKMFDI